MALTACASAPPAQNPAATPLANVSELIDSYDGGDLTFIGSPQAVAIGFDGTSYVADISPGRIVAFDADGKPQEFQTPSNRAFFPTDVAVNGFFIYAIDEPGRRLLRFDRAGNFRDVLIDFESLGGGRRVSPYGLDIEPSGRMAVTDVENHQILIIDTFLQVELEFGNFGAFPGQFDRPEGVAFAPDGGIVVADTGNRRVSFFSRAGTFLRQIPATDGDSPLVRPRRVAVDRSRVYVADPGANEVFVFDVSGDLVGAMGHEKKFDPRDVALSASGLLFVPDASSGRLYIYKGK